MSENYRAAPMDLVTLDFIGKLPDGKVFDTSIEDEAKKNNCYHEDRGYGPVTFQIGKNQMLTGIERAVQGMVEGEEKEVTLPPDEAYGNQEDYPKETVDISEFKANNIEPEIGMELDTTKGFARVEDIEDNNAILQYFHPLMEMEVSFWIKVKNIQKSR